MDAAVGVGRAIQLVNQGRQGDAKELLLGLGDLAAITDPIVRFQALRTLARCHRLDGELDEARARALEALELAPTLANPAAEAVILESLAMIERDDGKLRAAAKYFFASAEAESQRGDLAGMAAALSNYGNMLLDNGLEGAEPLLRRALNSASGTPYYALAADNMGLELERQGRHDEAVEWGKEAVQAFRALGQPHEVFVALRNLARHLADAGQRQQAAEAFEEAHDLIHSLRRAEVDEAHYARYPERVAGIEAHTEELLKAEGSAWLTIGSAALLGGEFLEDGIRQLEEGLLADAVESLEKSREQWLKLEATHCIVRVDYNLAYAYVELGREQEALELAYRVRGLARSLGDAERESMALSLLVRLRELTTGKDALDHIAQTRALDGAVARQLGADRDESPSFDGGVMAALAAQICADSYAYEMAERYMVEAVAAGRRLPGLMRYRLTYRLANFYDLLRRAGESARAAQVLPELRRVVAELEGDPRAERVLSRILTRHAFSEGDRSAETLSALLEECRAYELMRDRAQGAGGLEGFSEAADPPFEEAAEVALALNRPRLALVLLELGKARTLLEALALDVPEIPTLEEEDPPAPAVGKAIGLELFVTQSGVTLLGLDGLSGEVTSLAVPEEAGSPRLDGLLRALADAADSERSVGGGGSRLEPVLNHPTFLRLCRSLLEAAPLDRTVCVAPHRFLHQAPLQLAPWVVGSGEPLAWTIVPALSVARVFAPPRIERPGSVMVVCGDPLGDLPFARMEARLVASNGGSLALGEECDADWLREHCGDDLGVIHLACHGRFDRRHPERSGLILAGADGEALAGTVPSRLLKVEEIAALQLDGVVVVLSACSTGLEAVRDGDEATGLISALVRAGASAIVAAQWPIPDLSAMLLMVDFYKRLQHESGTTDLRRPLGAAAQSVRTMSAFDLCEYGFRLAERATEIGASEKEALEVAAACLGTALTAMGDTASTAIVGEVVHSNPQGGDVALKALEGLRPVRGERSVVSPFSAPLHWGAFVIVGRGGTARPKSIRSNAGGRSNAAIHSPS